jgi:quercetin dioxygenase-like cupin family protein
MSDNNYMYFTDIAREVQTPENGIFSRTLVNNDHVKIILFGFGAGQELTAHTAPMQASIHIIQGSARLTLGADTHEAATGAWANMPPNLEHGIYAVTPVVMLLTMYKQSR